MITSGANKKTLFTFQQFCLLLLILVSASSHTSMHLICKNSVALIHQVCFYYLVILQRSQVHFVICLFVILIYFSILVLRTRIWFSLCYFLVIAYLFLSNYQHCKQHFRFIFYTIYLDYDGILILKENKNMPSKFTYMLIIFI